MNQGEKWKIDFTFRIGEEENKVRTALTCSESTYPEVGGRLEFLWGSEIRGSWCERVGLGLEYLVWVGS